MSLIKKIEKFINSTLENSIAIKNLSNKFLKTKKPVLILGDGISSIYIHDILNRYEYIICCNITVLKKINNFSPLYCVLMESDLLTFKKKTLDGFEKFIQILVNKLKDLKNTVGVFHPLGRIFNFHKWRMKNSLFLSPYHKLKLDSGDIYESFDGAFGACLGMALLSGFKNIHCAGFDGWLLSPKNTLRWYSRSSNPNDYDKNIIESCPKFLNLASKNAKLSVYTYAHYKLKYKFLSEIKSTHKTIYIPEIDRSKYMDKDVLAVWREYEDRKFPNGYEG
jgi:hypothetical protein